MFYKNLWLHIERHIDYTFNQNSSVVSDAKFFWTYTEMYGNTIKSFRYWESADEGFSE